MKIAQAKAKLSVVRGRIATRLPDTHESIQALDLALWLMKRESVLRPMLEHGAADATILRTRQKLIVFEIENPRPGENT